jgi:predicted RNA-binding Zn ribbon-like protein
MKTCRNPACRWAFYDTTRNRSAVWCDMAACGNRAKARSYYARRARPAG